MALVMVTGGAGFIGRELVHQLYVAGHHIVVVDKGTYAARFDLLHPYRDRCRVVERDLALLDHLFGVEVVFHLAAESHVDNSITDAGKFLDSNILATYHLLELIRGQRPHDRPLLIHMSTDEVYGDQEDFEPDEWAPFRPSNPYAASKASAELLVASWARTYGLTYNILRGSNTYGPDQYPEKLIPKTIRAARLGRPMTIHGDGSQTRSWLSVEDCAKALVTVWERGCENEVFNIPGNAEVSVRSVVQMIQGITDEYGYALPAVFGCDRPGGDLRYCVNGERLLALGWEPEGVFRDDLERIVRAELESPILI